MDISNFDYHLSPILIAQKPLAKRDNSRLLVINRLKKTIEHRHFSDILNLLSPNDVLVLNNTKVFPARIFEKKKLEEK
jgi:S-adenosylmethionine:tRNA ribosyltransferase-isomerase